MSQTIIQLSEKNSVSNQNSLTPNGDFEITLRDKVEVRDGDRVDLKSVFVDSVQASEGKITIDEDVSGFVEVVPYIYNWNTTEKDYNNNGVGDATTLENQPDGKHYFASEKVAVKNANLRKYQSVVLCRMFKHDDGAPEPMRPCVITIQYTRNDGNKDTFKLTVPQDFNENQLFIHNIPGDPFGNDPRYSYQPGAFVEFVNTAGQDDPGKSMTLISPSSDDLERNFNVATTFIGGDFSQDPDVFNGFCEASVNGDPGPNTSNMGSSIVVPAVNGGILHPRKKQKTFTVNKGEYFMSELCEIVSDQISANGSLSSRPMNNALLTSDLQIKSEEGIDNTNTTDFIYYVAEDASNVFKYANNITDDFFIGTDQFGLVADNATAKAKFVALHSNLYDNNGSVVVKYIKDGTRAGANFFQANKNGGVVITDLSPPTFWEKLGFGQADTPTQKSIISHTQPGTVLTKGNINQLGIYKMDAVSGVNLTGATTGIADAIVKVSGNNAVFDKVQDVNNLNINTNTTTQIFAQTGQSQAVQRDGYFKIRVDLGIQNDLVSDRHMQTNIQGVISKYFSTNSYTSDMGTGSISYIHRGQPTYISRVRVQILNGEDNIDDNIGDDNTVFLAITRATPS